MCYSPTLSVGHLHQIDLSHGRHDAYALKDATKAEQNDVTVRDAHDDPTNQQGKAKHHNGLFAAYCAG